MEQLKKSRSSTHSLHRAGAAANPFEGADHCKVKVMAAQATMPPQKETMAQESSIREMFDRLVANMDV